MELVFAELQYQYNSLNIVGKILIVVYLIIFLSKNFSFLVMSSLE